MSSPKPQAVASGARSAAQIEKSLKALVHEALAEDLGSGDVTSAIFTSKERGKAHFLAKQAGVLSGAELIAMVFKELDPKARVKLLKKNGESFEPGGILAEVEAPLAALFSGERLALNFLQRASGVATQTRRYVEALGEDSPIGIYDTRKTTPLLRIVEKRAVRDGGGRNHRFGLDDMAMLKNNHIDAAGGIEQAVERLRQQGFFDRKPRLPLCIEARTLEEVQKATEAGCDIVLLDNMTPAQMKKACELIRSTAKQRKTPVPQIEISGGVTLKSLPKLRDLPVDRISVGALTHSVPSIDISMRIQPQSVKKG